MDKPLTDSPEPNDKASSDRLLSSSNFSKGMFVRIPSKTALEEEASDFRDYQVGCVIEEDPLAGTLAIELWVHELNANPQAVIVTVPVNWVHRCRILANTPCYHRVTGQTGILLDACLDDLPLTAFLDYYVMMDGIIAKVPEHHLRVAAHRQDVDPLDQLMRYEFHNPTYRYGRDRFLQSYLQLHNATAGLDELVNTRVLLLAHQAEVITRVLGDDTCRYILADEVGLGKTIEACVIMKGLLNRHGNFKTLVITPSALIYQWYNELNSKFWIRLSSWAKLISRVGQPFDAHGLIISHEELEKNDSLWRFVQSQPWGLMIVDEAHHIPRYPALYERLHTLSAKITRVLVLSATPIQHRSTEYLSMLRLMHPQRYDALNETIFQQIVANQKTLYDAVETIQGSLDPDYFDTQEFAEVMAPLVTPLAADVFFTEQLGQISRQPSNASSLAQARQLVTYLSENYRIESRVIRNRRVHLPKDLLPQRAVDVQYAYTPSQAEQDTFNELLLYVQNLIVN